MKGSVQACLWGFLGCLCRLLWARSALWRLLELFPAHSCREPSFPPLSTGKARPAPRPRLAEEAVCVDRAEGSTRQSEIALPLRIAALLLP